VKRIWCCPCGDDLDDALEHVWMILGNCIESVKTFLDRCFTKKLDLLCVELGDVKPSLKHIFVSVENNTLH
jgi:hypothetical protein